jgi:hypothetical protein
MTSLAAYRTDVRNLLAAAPDVATWPDSIIDQALRLGLLDFDPHLVYETSVTVTSAGHEQDLSSLPGLLTVFAVAYPWDYTRDIDEQWVPWRWAGPQRVYLPHHAPRVGEELRVRHTKQHVIADLDGAAATTVPPHGRGLVVIASGAWACELRRRQISENPSLAPNAGLALGEMALRLRAARDELLSRLAPMGRLGWHKVGAK